MNQINIPLGMEQKRSLHLGHDMRSLLKISCLGPFQWIIQEYFDICSTKFTEKCFNELFLFHHLIQLTSLIKFVILKFVIRKNFESLLGIHITKLILKV